MTKAPFLLLKVSYTWAVWFGSVMSGLVWSGLVWFGYHLQHGVELIKSIHSMIKVFHSVLL